jgi:hypothetical protein
LTVGQLLCRKRNDEDGPEIGSEKKKDPNYQDCPNYNLEYSAWEESLGEISFWGLRLTGEDDRPYVKV